MGQVIDMAGRTLADGEAVEDKAQEYNSVAKVWHGAPVYALELAKELSMDYCDVAAYTIHSLLREAEDSAEKHEKAAQLLEFIRDQFFAGEE